MSSEMTDSDWTVLLSRIDGGRAMPFLGAGASYPAAPLGAELAKTLAKEFNYPFPDDSDLSRVAQYIAVNFDPLFPKERVVTLLKAGATPNFLEPDEPHGVLATLPLPVYMTTNYDPFMFKALANRHKAPRRELCQWNQLLKSKTSIFSGEVKLHPATPIVYHIHGHDEEMDSLVLTEDDYLDFLAEMTRNPAMLPAPIQGALQSTSLMFIGYRLADANLRVLLKGLRPDFKFLSVIVLRPPGRGKNSADQEQIDSQRKYLDKYYGALNLRVFWGTAREFCAELSKRYNLLLTMRNSTTS